MKVIREIQENLVCVVKKEGDDHEKDYQDEALVQQDWAATEREAHR